MNKTIVVFGQSRSGTSMIMEILLNLDIDVGDVFKETKMNSNGSFEELTIGCCLWRQERRLFPTDGEHIAKTKDKYFYELHNINDCKQLRKEFTENLEDKNKRYSTWAFKNPVFIHQWRALVDLINNPYFIVIKRNLESNVKSFSKWAGYSLEESTEIVKFRNELVDTFAKETTYPTLIINYEELTKNVHESIQKIADFVGREATEGAEKCVKKK